MVSMNLPCQREELILLHLRGYSDYKSEEEVPYGVSTSGIARSIAADREETSKMLQGLIDEGLIESSVRGVRGRKRRRKVYFLTDQGREEEGEIRRRIEEESVKVNTGEKTKEIKLENIDEFIQREDPLVKTITSLDNKGFVDLSSGVGKGDIFVGRDDELSRLRNLLDEVKDTGCKAVFVAGEAGVGKTRLVSELKPYALEEGYDFLAGTSHSEVADPYLPLKEAFQRYTERSEDVSGDTSGMAFLGVPEDKEVEGKKMFDAERQATFYETTKYVKDIASRNPLLVFLDDVQWLDRASAEILHYMLDKIDESPILFICAYRPEDLDDEGVLKENIRKMSTGYQNVSSMELSSLGIESTGKIIKVLLGREDVPSGYVKMLHRKTDGNPLFVKECVKHMLSEGMVDPGMNKYPSEAEEIDVPDIIQQVIERRINRLNEGTKKVLDIGSVIGNVVPFELLSEVSSLETFELLDHVDILRGNQLWHESADEEKFYFHHDIIKDAVYNNLRNVKKRVLHGKIAEALREELSDEELKDRCPRLAYHYSRAGKDSEAMEFYIRGASQAEKVYAHEDAIEMYHEALDIAEEIGEKDKKLDILDDLGKAYRLTGEFEEAVSTFEEAIDVVDDRKREASFRRKLARICEKMGKYDKVIEECDEGLELLDDGDKEEKSELLSAQGRAYMKISEYYEAKDIQDRSLSIAEESGGREKIANAHHEIGTVEWYRSNYQNALEHFEEALEIREDIDDKQGIANSLNNIGLIYYDREELEEALEYHKRSREIAEEIGNKWSVSTSLNNIGIIYYKKAEWDEALRYFEDCYWMDKKMGDDQGTAYALTNIGNIYLYKGDLKKALDNYKESLELERKIGNRRGEASALTSVGMIHSRKEQFDQALKRYEESLEIREEIEDEEGIATSYNHLGWLYLYKGELEEALSSFEKGAEVGSELELDNYLIDSYGGISECLAEKGEQKERSLDKAKKALEMAQETQGEEKEEAHRILGKAYREFNELERAEEELNRAKDITEEREHRMNRADVLYELGLLYSRQGDKERSRSILNDAFGIFEDMGLRLQANWCRSALIELEE